MDLLDLVPLGEVLVLVLEVFAGGGGAAFTAALEALGDGLAGFLALEVSALEVSIAALRRDESETT